VSLAHDSRALSRDAYWRAGSVCEDYSRITCPVLLVGGFADLYTDPVFRLMDQLRCPKRAIIGPWGHQYPYVVSISDVRRAMFIERVFACSSDEAFPGPRIGFVKEVLEWLDHHVKGLSNNGHNDATRCEHSKA
jgi:uncharacterized protein